jgi:acyl-CoA reductase-like NAD-dependent aldehyde dehydrogenase
MTRIPVTKTPKVYVGGAFIRSESARTFALRDRAGEFVANIPQCTRKDLRNAVEAAAKAGPGWAKRTGYNRGQILYRLAEMLEARAGELRDSILIGGAPAGKKRDASAEVALSVDRLVHYAGWADKYEHLLGSVNPVSGPFFNFTVTEPMGVVGVIAGDTAPLLALLSLIAPAIVSGNTVVALASERNPYPAILLGELLATSDLPGGVVNLLTGYRKEMIPTFASHAHIRALSAICGADDGRLLATGAADSVKRVRLKDPLSWDVWADDAQGLEWIRALVECKTTWHPIGA